MLFLCNLIKRHVREFPSEVVTVTKVRNIQKKMSSPDVVKRLNQSFSALQQYFSPSRKQEGTGNPSQLVLFAEHAAKVRENFDGMSGFLKRKHTTEWLWTHSIRESGALSHFRPSS